MSKVLVASGWRTWPASTAFLERRPLAGLGWGRCPCRLVTLPPLPPSCARTPALPGASRGTQGVSHFIIAPDSTGGLTFKTVSTRLIFPALW